MLNRTSNPWKALCWSGNRSLLLVCLCVSYWAVNFLFTAPIKVLRRQGDRIPQAGSRGSNRAVSWLLATVAMTSIMLLKAPVVMVMRFTYRGALPSLSLPKLWLSAALVTAGLRHCLQETLISEQEAALVFEVSQPEKRWTTWTELKESPFVQNIRNRSASVVRDVGNEAETEKKWINFKPRQTKGARIKIKESKTFMIVSPKYDGV